MIRPLRRRAPAPNAAPRAALGAPRPTPPRFVIRSLPPSANRRHHPPSGALTANNAAPLQQCGSPDGYAPAPPSYPLAIKIPSCTGREPTRRHLDSVNGTAQAQSRRRLHRQNKTLHTPPEWGSLRVQKTYPLRTRTERDREGRACAGGVRYGFPPLAAPQTPRLPPPSLNR
jgi:hypothetical protein